jgi:hypothetical protein
VSLNRSSEFWGASESPHSKSRFLDREIPNGSKALTFDHRSSGLGVLVCPRIVCEFRDIAKPDFPTSQEEIAEEIAVGKELSRELKESLTLRA